MPLATKEAQREYQRQWVAARRAEWFEGRACIDCGGTERLEIDHVDPALKIDSHVWSWSEPRRLAELAKCVVRCQPCHVQRHRAGRPEHGTGAYKRGCRCEICREAKSAHDKAYRASRPRTTSRPRPLVPTAQAPTLTPALVLEYRQPDERPFLTPQEVAQRLGVPVAELSRLLPSYRIGALQRFAPVDIDAYLREAA